jgi:hypothetical protein
LMNKTKIFVIGVIIGSMLVQGVSFAADKLQLEVNLPLVSYWLDGEKLELNSGGNETTFMAGGKEMPLTILYNDTSYVPLRMLSQAVGKEIEWDAKNQRVNLFSVERLPYETVDPSQSPEPIQEWIERSKDKKMAQFMIVGDEAYVLVTRGEKSTGGYDVNIQSIKKYASKSVITVEMTDPPKGAIVSQAVTYPYVLIKLKGELHGDVIFRDLNGQIVPQLVDLDYLPAVHNETANIALFPPFVVDDSIVLQGIVRSFEGLIIYSLMNDKGETVQTVRLQAGGAAPNWGYFQHSLGLDELTPGMSVTFHTVNSKDGSAEETLTLKWNEMIRD